MIDFRIKTQKNTQNCRIILSIQYQFLIINQSFIGFDDQQINSFFQNACKSGDVKFLVVFVIMYQFDFVHHFLFHQLCL